MDYFFDNPNPSVRETIYAIVLQEYLQKCIKEMDKKALENTEAELAIQTLQEILFVMQNGKEDDRELLLKIDDIFARKLKQRTEKGNYLRKKSYLSTEKSCPIS